MLSTILVGLLATAISGISGYLISYRFNSSDYAGSNTSGDFGTPRGGFFALLSGSLIGMIFFSLVSHLSILPADTIGVGMITSMVVGAVAGVVGLFRGSSVRGRKQ